MPGDFGRNLRKFLIKKIGFLRKHMRSYNVIFIQESHLTEDEESAFIAMFENEGWVCLFNSKSSAKRGGVIMIRNNLLENVVVNRLEIGEKNDGYSFGFRITNMVCDYVLINVYLDSASEQVRCRQIAEIGSKIPAGCHAFVMGDFNCVSSEGDRIRIKGMAGPELCRVNIRETEIIDQLFLEEIGMQEETLDCHTYISRGEVFSSKIDRIFTNFDSVDATFSEIDVFAPHIDKWYSDHRPIALIIKEKSFKSPIPNIPAWIPKRDDWGSTVENVYFSMTESKSDCKWRRLDALGDAMIKTAKRLKAKSKEKVRTNEDKLVISSSFWAEMNKESNIDWCKIKRYCNLYPELEAFYSFETVGGNFQLILDSHSFRKLHASLLAGSDQETNIESMGHNIRDSQFSIAKELKRSRPGKNKSFKYVRDPDTGEISCDPSKVSKITAKHWQNNVWDGKVIDEVKMRNFVSTFQKTVDNNTNFNISKEDVMIAIERSKDTSPGKDGIPFIAYRRCKLLATDVIYDCIADLLSDNPGKIPKQFSELLLYFLPKSASGEEEASGEPFYDPDKLRPISVARCCIRVISAVFRKVLVQVAINLISWKQRGFIDGRLIDQNIWEVSERFYDRVEKEAKAGTILLDFSAAFSSVNQNFISCVFEKMNFPANWIYAMEKLFYGGEHFLVFGGEIHRHSSIRSGTRQGDPCSPIIFVLLLEVLTDKLEEVQNVGIDWRGYADDLVLFLEGVTNRGIRKIANIFYEMEQVSGLSLNIRKCKFVPCRPWSNDELSIFKRTRWSQMAHNVSYQEKYLGINYGYSLNADDVWKEPIAKFESETAKWSKLVSTISTRILIANVFLIPILMFVGQFYILSKIASQKIKRILLRFLTPMLFIPLYVLNNLEDLLNFPKQVNDFVQTNVAAILRCTRNFPDRRDSHHMCISAQKRQAVRLFTEWAGPWDEFYGSNVNSWFVNKKLIQKSISKKIKENSAPTEEFHKWVSAKLGRWYEGVTALSTVAWVNAFKKTFHDLKNSKAQIVFLRFLGNAVATKRRTRFFSEWDRNECVFCKELNSEDSVEHWFDCQVLGQFMWTYSPRSDIHDMFLTNGPLSKEQVNMWMGIYKAHNVLVSSKTNIANMNIFIRSWIRYVSPIEKRRKKPIKNHGFRNLMDHKPIAAYYKGAFRHLINADHREVKYWGPRDSDIGIADCTDLVKWNSHVHVYSDGSEKEGKGGSGYCVLGWGKKVVDKGVPIDEGMVFDWGENAITNNFAELYAVYDFLLTLSVMIPEAFRVPITIIVDSEVTLGRVINPPALNKLAQATHEIFRRMRRTICIRLIHNYSHTGIIWNERADQIADLAREGKLIDTWVPYNGDAPNFDDIVGQNLCNFP